MSIRTKAYLDFMDWLKEHHPEIQKNYHNNFSVPKKQGEGVSVNHSFKISTEEYNMLNKITHSYYEKNKF
jgi:hypothetical protein